MGGWRAGAVRHVVGEDVSVERYDYLEWEARLHAEIGRLEPDHDYDPTGSTIRRAIANLKAVRPDVAAKRLREIDALLGDQR